MDSDLLQRVRDALDGWLRGDIAPLAALMHPDVELVGLRQESSERAGKEPVMGFLTQRSNQRTPEGDMELFDAGEDALVVVRSATALDGNLPATLVMFSDGKIKRIEQFRTKEEATAAARWRR
jgi:ketosteroid isomerase-like protein